MRGKHASMLREACNYMLNYRDNIDSHDETYPKITYIVIKLEDGRISKHAANLGGLEWINNNGEQMDVTVLFSYNNMCDLLSDHLNVFPRTAKEYVKMLCFPYGPFVRITFLKKQYIAQSTDDLVEKWMRKKETNPSVIKPARRIREKKIVELQQRL